MATMLDYRQALALLLAHCTPLPAQLVAPAQAHGRVLAAAVEAGLDLPPFDNAAMDGYALASGGAPLPAGGEYPIDSQLAAGDAPYAQATVGCKIMTGAPMPIGLDSVAPLEISESLPGSPTRMRLRESLRAGQNVRLAGSDIGLGERAMAAGQRVDSAASMLLAALGVAEVSVRRPPRVWVISTGKELVDDPTQALAPGQIYGSNAAYLTAALQALGAELVGCDTVGDHPERYRELIRESVGKADLVLSTGAVSAGEFDYVPQALRDCAAELLFHKVAIRPGKPLLCARLPGNGPLLLGLPGNPMAVAVGWRFFVAPALRAMEGRAAEAALWALLDAPCQPKPGLRQFLRARLYLDAQARLRARVLPGQDAFRIRPLLAANGWIALPEDGEPLLEDARVSVFPRDAGGGLDGLVGEDGLAIDG